MVTWIQSQSRLKQAHCGLQMSYGYYNVICNCCAEWPEKLILVTNKSKKVWYYYDSSLAALCNLRRNYRNDQTNFIPCHIMFLFL